MRGLEFRIVGRTASATKSIDNLRSSLKSTAAQADVFKRALSAMSTGGLKLLRGAVTRATAPVKEFAKKINSVGAAFKRVLFYRAIRSLIRKIGEAFKYGTNNLYAWSQAVDGRFAASMDRITTAFNYFKNSLGAAVAPIINALAPAIDYLIDKIVSLLNVINQLFAKLTGATYWTKANKVAAQYADNASAAGSAAKEALRYLAPFDELNVLPSNNGGGGGGGGGGAVDSGLFETQEAFSESVTNFVDMLKEAWTNGDWEGVGQFLGGKINQLIEDIDWGGIGTNVGKFVNALWGTQYWTLDTINFTNLGARIAEFLNNAISHIDWDIAGRLPVKKLTSIIDTVLGFLGNLDWSQIGTAISSYVTGAFSEITEWIQSKDWNQMGQNLYDNIVEFLESVDWAGVIKSIIRFIGEAAQAANSFAGGILDRFTADAIFGDEMWTNLKTKFATGWNNFIDSLMDNKYVGNILDFFGIDLSGAKLEIPVTATITDRKIGAGFDSTIYGMTSQFSYRALASGYDPTIYGMTSQFRYRNFSGSYVDTVYGMTSQFRYKSVASNFPSTITGMTASFSSAIIGGVKYNSIMARAGGGAFYGGSWHDIPQYASGTLNAGSIFVAGEAGPEIVGHINGRTEVLNASQIASAIAAGVSMYSAPGNNEDTEELLYRAFIRALSETSSGGDIYLDGEKIYQSVVTHNTRNTRMTGVNAFA